MSAALLRALPLLLLAAAGPSGDRPAAVASRDAVLGYHLRPATGEAIDVRVAIQAGNKAMRVDLPDGSYVLAVPSSRSVTMVVPLERTSLRLGWAEGPQSLFTTDEQARFVRKAESTVAGQRCTLWDAVLDGGTRTMCVTSDGLVLRNHFLDAQGRRSLVEAFSLRYDSLPDEDFAVPEGYEPIQPDRSPAQ